jgi:LL-diaminopimelate aminotransferase
MTGWRIGMAVGNKNVIEALLKIKTNTDSGVFQAIQLAVEGALKNYSSLTEQVRQTYKRRRKIVEEALDEGGLLYHKSNATFYVWVKVGDNSRGFAKSLLEKHGIVVTPGIGFGEAGEGYIRISLTVSDDELKEACTILKGLKFA